ncbi:glycerate kinase [Micromonospora narathiwatensis]|uniref:Glycerate kinase n=1 Tax=Micromonospora narathiwatensis TaxID=299146 RepID=A0A1A8ZNM4_9ACTN|nr:glycerate kinase [Micromonospora narathiwatensis]SBT45474.1 glycerate kinase [Micromonospora narathiwatensis]
MRIVVAPDSFKGSITADDAARALAHGWLACRPGDDIRLLPLADGGEGTVDAFAAALPGAERRTVAVPGPDGRPVDAAWLLLPDGGAVLELAQSSGLPLMAAPDPLGAHTYGLGMVARAALDAGATRLVIGLGGSASTDGGTGALRALGLRLRDVQGRELPLGGAALTDLAEIDVTDLLPAPPGGVQVLVDVTAPLTGPAGAATVYGPQKGAAPADVTLLDAALRRLAGLAGGDPAESGAGAAGGTAYGLAALWGARIVPGATTIAALVGLADALAGADVLLTGEGRFDETSLTGKVVGSLLAAGAGGARVGVAAGQVTGPVPGSVAAVSLVELAGSVDAALHYPARWLTEAGAVLAGRLGAGRVPAVGCQMPDRCPAGIRSSGRQIAVPGGDFSSDAASAG